MFYSEEFQFHIAHLKSFLNRGLFFSCAGKILTLKMPIKLRDSLQRIRMYLKVYWRLKDYSKKAWAIYILPQNSNKTSYISCHNVFLRPLSLNPLVVTFNRSVYPVMFFYSIYHNQMRISTKNNLKLVKLRCTNCYSKCAQFIHTV